MLVRCVTPPALSVDPPEGSAGQVGGSWRIEFGLSDIINVPELLKIRAHYNLHRCAGVQVAWPV
jgi:hypothetical protein